MKKFFCFAALLGAAASSFAYTAHMNAVKDRIDVAPMVFTMTQSNLDVVGRKMRGYQNSSYQAKLTQVGFYKPQDAQGVTSDWLPALVIGKQISYMHEIRSYEQILDASGNKGVSGTLLKTNGDSISWGWSFRAEFRLCKKVDDSSTLSESDCKRVIPIGDVIADDSSIWVGISPDISNCNGNAKCFAPEPVNNARNIRFDINLDFAKFEVSTGPQALASFDGRMKQFALAESQKIAELQSWRKGLKEGASTNCGMVIEAKKEIANVQLNGGGTKWIRLEELDRPGKKCYQ